MVINIKMLIVKQLQTMPFDISEENDFFICTNFEVQSLDMYKEFVRELVQQ